MHIKIQSVLDMSKIVFVIVIYAFELSLLLVLLPFIVWKWISAKHHIITILRTIIEVRFNNYLILWILKILNAILLFFVSFLIF